MYEECKTFGHQWDDVPPSSTRTRPLFGYPVELRCLRCTATAAESWNDFGQRITPRRYIYPPGYRSENGRMTKEELRMQLRKAKARAARKAARDRRAAG